MQKNHFLSLKNLKKYRKCPALQNGDKIFKKSNGPTLRAVKPLLLRTSTSVLASYSDRLNRYFLKNEI